VFFLAAKDKLNKLKNKAKPISLVALSIVGSIASKLLTDKFEKQVNIQDINVTVYNYIINSLTESSILEFFQQFDHKINIVQPSKDLSKVDAAYEFIMKNIELKKSKGIDINFQKDEESITISYIFDKEHSDVFYEKGLTSNEVFAIAQAVGNTEQMLSECIKENLGFTVPIKIKVYTNIGDLLVFIDNGQLIQLNGIRPAIETEEI
jgi:hypothetical protein